jgi:hypothetical protein
VSVKAGIPPLPRRKITPDSLLGQIPASSYHAGQRAVLLHPAVLHRKPPRFVLRYLLHHGLAEARREHTGHAIGCHHVLCPILAYGNRVNRWLAAEGFPPIHPESAETAASLPPDQRPAMAKTVNGGMIEWHGSVVPIIVEDPPANVFAVQENPGKGELQTGSGTPESGRVPEPSTKQYAVSNRSAVIQDIATNSLIDEQEQPT